MNIYLLAHSGVAVEWEDRVLVFDAWRDPAGHLPRLMTGTRPVWWLVTHAHADHYQPALARQYADRLAGMVLAAECDATGLPREKVQQPAPGDTITLGDMTVDTYGSTDSGGSYAVTTPHGRIFHAGDLNWWHWTGEPEAENEAMRKLFLQEMAPLEGLVMEVAFFPVDHRQGPAEEWGVLDFLQRVTVRRRLVPIHRNGAPWEPSLYYRWKYRDVPVWTGLRDGDMRQEG